ncbi:MAG: hypothetical protein ACJ8NS_03195 [Chthoniobacterales bacterium]
MRVAPEHSHSGGSTLPWLPLPAILGFTLLGVGGSVLITYSTFSFAETERPAPPSDHTRVYEARAVAFENPAQRVASIARALTATQSKVRRAETVESERPESNSQPTLLADSTRELRGFPGFGNFSGANSYLAVSNTSFGMSAQSAPAGFAAPDAEALVAAPVPEASTWMCGAALFVLVAARGMRAHWHRKRERD